jgi:hypothetical protein
MGSNFYFRPGMYFQTGQVIFVLEWPKGEFVSILASFCIWTKSLKCKDAVNMDSTIQSLQVRRNSSSLSAVRTIEPSRPDAYLSTIPSVQTTCHPVRTLDRPASSVRTKCSFRPDPILYREVSVPACIRRTSGRLPVFDQFLISFQVPRKGRSVNHSDDVVSRPDARLCKARIAIQI